MRVELSVLGRLNIHTLLNKFSEKEINFRQQRFFAPYTKFSKTAIIKLDGINYTFCVQGHKGDGFGIFEPIDYDRAKFIMDADYHQTKAYFDIIPQVHLTLCYESSHGWIAYPMNLNASKNAIGLDQEIIVLNVSNCEQFDVVTAGHDGVNFWFKEQFVGADIIKSHELRKCFIDAIKQKKQTELNVKGLTPEDRTVFSIAQNSWRLFQKSTTEDKIKTALTQAGGHLAKYVVRGDLIDIKWQSSSGKSYTSTVKTETFDVVSAGICLSGYDSKFHLKDLPFIIEQGERRDLIYRTGDARLLDFDNEE